MSDTSERSFSLDNENETTSNGTFDGRLVQ